VAFASEDALRYVAREALEWATLGPVVTGLTWRRRTSVGRAPFDAYLVAPATHSTIAKMAHGIGDTVVTSALISALGRMEQGRTQVLVAPTMHGTMHNAQLVDNARRLAAQGVRFVAPRDAYGKHNLPDTELLCIAVGRALSTSPLAGKRIMVTAGPTPVEIDNVRRIVNRFRGRLGAQVAEELTWRGAEAELILGDGAWRPSAPIPLTVARTYDAYRDLCSTGCGRASSPASSRRVSRLPAGAGGVGQDRLGPGAADAGTGADREGDRPGLRRRSGDALRGVQVSRGCGEAELARVAARGWTARDWSWRRAARTRPGPSSARFSSPPRVSRPSAASAPSPRGSPTMEALADRRFDARQAAE
jgi:hypothetical protein